MMPVFVLGALLTLALVAALMYLIYTAPRAYVKLEFQTACRFVVAKFHARKYWFGIVLLLRSLCLGLVEVVEPNQAFVQVILMQVTLGASLVMHSVHLPYADEYGNKLETVELVIMLLMLSIGSYFNDPRDMSDGFSLFLRNILIMLMCIAFVCVIATGIYAAYLLRRPEMVKERTLEGAQRQLEKLVSISHVVLAKEAAEVEQVLAQTSYIDQWHLTEVVNFLSLEILGMRPSRFSESRLPKVASDVSEGGVEELKSHARRLSISSKEGSLRNSFKQIEQEPEPAGEIYDV
jgi:hypothetical protein